MCDSPPLHHDKPVNSVSTGHQYRYRSCLNGPFAPIPRYSACLVDKVVSFAPTLARCSAATFSSRCFGKV